MEFKDVDKENKLVFYSEDEAFEAYLEHCQENYPYDITESNIDFSDWFFDWMDSYNVEITDE